ncbi:MAG: DUF547 domain-containing protein [Rhodospirillales bacterium]|nr:DUF547 domain-containing protein [Rhodospirillales bacterium]
MRVFARIAACLAVLAFALLGTGAEAAPRSELWPRWEAHQADSTLVVDHSAWDEILARYNVPAYDGSRRFAYGRVSTDDHRRLGEYVDGLARVNVSALARAEQRAYWINLYNSLTVKLVLERWPVASIRDIAISPGLFSAGPWGKKLATVEGKSLSLDDIEHRILRPIWKDPRIHYAVNCAAIGCPDLWPAAFTAANTEEILERAARAFVNHPRGARIEARRLVVSSIYIWFGDDFGDGTEAAVIAHLSRYAAPNFKAALAGLGRISGHGYDWAINAPLK